MSDKMREEFHEWCSSIGFTLKMNALGNDYAIGYGLEQWQAWQASRAALVVELPNSFMVDEDGYVFDIAGKEIVESLTESLKSLGISYK